ncbi:MAG: MazG nucleotide pyrophosphohydrolase domain-containing protein [Candidatus Pacebacteria bacterium]|nr:MazG nucleotide pyrophosphohydrolase domain-containing protein [Candidatus Paceibacterota bacterium]
METKDLQQICTELTARIDEKYEIDRDPQLAFAQLIEEIGELAVDINRPALRNQALDEESLKQDFADIFLLLSALANIYDIDIETAMQEKIEILKERHELQ